MIGKLIELIKRLMRFIHHELWEVELSKLPPHLRFLVRLLRTGHLIVKGVREDHIPLHASALTLGTLISIVPVMAVMFSMYKGLGAREEDIKLMLLEWMEQMPVEFQDFVLQMLDLYAQTNFAALGGIFLAVVLVIVIRMLAGIEAAFNRVWYITTSRNILRKISNYISVLVVVPILVIAASAVSAVVDAFLKEQWESVAFIYRGLLRLGPLLAVWLAFSFLYMFIPNTRVKLGAGLISGFVGAVMWMIWQTIFIQFQFGVARYNAIYGTFATVPIFLAWLYVSWIIVLLGAEVAFAVQNSSTYKLERAASGASARSKLMLAVGVIRRAGEVLKSGGEVFDLSEYAREKQVSIRLVNEVVRLLGEAGLIAALAERPGCYVLMKTPEAIPLKEVVDVVLQEGSGPEDLGLDHLDATVQRVLADLDAGLEKSLDHLTVKDLLKVPAKG